MNDVPEILRAIVVGVTVANFLLNIGRALKAIDLDKEVLVLLNDKALSIKKQVRQNINHIIDSHMFDAYRRVGDHTSALECGRKLLASHRECGDTVREGIVSIAMAQIYFSQSLFAEANELCECVRKPLATHREWGDTVQQGLVSIADSMARMIHLNQSLFAEAK